MRMATRLWSLRLNDTELIKQLTLLCCKAKQVSMLYYEN